MRDLTMSMQHYIKAAYELSLEGEGVVLALTLSAAPPFRFTIPKNRNGGTHMTRINLRPLVL